MNELSKAAILEAREIRFGHGKGTSREKPLGGPLDLSLRKGELVCLLGPNGAGKSTLLRTLCGFLAPLSGTVQIAGRPISDYTPRDLARIRGVLPTREAPPAGMRVEELVSLGRHPHSHWTGRLTAEDRSAIDNAFAETGSEPFRHRPIGELSDGERQRVALARLLSQEPELTFLDEPAAFLDLPSRIEILGKLSSVARTRNIAILLTTHDLESALRHADRIWLLSHQGQLREGTPEDLVLAGAYQETFTSPSLTFDITQGNFHPRKERGTPIQLSGPDPHRHWTARALERKGWEATQDGGTDKKIEIQKEGESFRWTLHLPGDLPSTHPSIGQCLDVLGRG